MNCKTDHHWQENILITFVTDIPVGRMHRPALLKLVMKYGPKKSYEMAETLLASELILNGTGQGT
jgi:hypothetical protein